MLNKFVRKCFMLFAALILLLSGCSVQSSSPQANMTFAAPYSYSFDVDAMPDNTCSFILDYFTTSLDSKITNKEIKNVYIASRRIEESETPAWVEAKIINDDISKNSTKIDGKEIYPGHLELQIRPEYNTEFLDAYLFVNYKDGTQEKLYIGDFAFQENNDVFNEESAPYMDMAVMYSASNPNAYGGVSVNAILIECNALDPLELTSVDFGFSRIGIDADGIRYFTGAEIQNIKKHLDEHTLDQVIPGAYDKRIRPAQTDCHLHLEQGRNLIFVPLTYDSDNTPQVKKLFAELNINVGEQKVRYTITSNPLYSIYIYEDEEIEKFFSDMQRKAANM